MDIQMDLDQSPENMDMDMDIDKSEEIEEEKDQEMEDTRPVQEILSELAQETRINLNKYYNAVTHLESVLKRMDDSKELHIKVSGVKRKFQEFIEECSIKSRERLQKENSINFGQLLLKGLEEDEEKKSM